MPASQPKVVIARSAAMQMHRVAATQASQAFLDHDQSIGGILVGKRLKNDRIAILAASEPGSTPDNFQLGFALDTARANATLQSWFERDPDADFIGLWHTHPPDLGQPTAGDVEAAHALLQDPSYSAVELVNPINYVGAGGPVVRCYYVSRDDAVAGRPFSFVEHEVLDDDHPLLQPRPLPATAAPPQSLPPEASERSSDPSRSRTGLWLGLASLLVVLFLGGVMVVRGARDRTNVGVGVASGSGGLTSTTTATTNAENVPAAPTAETATVIADVAIAATTTLPVAITATPAPEQTTTASPVAPPTEAAPAVAPVVTEQTSAAAQTYTLRAEPMAAAARAAFLARTAQAGCSQCYNVDLVGPEPYTELRIQVDGGNRTIRTFDEPSLVQLTPRAEPYTLRVVDLQGNPVSEPLSLNVAAGEYYILRIVLPAT